MNENVAPWIMLSITVLVCVGSYHLTDTSMFKAIILGACGIGLNFLIACHVWDNQR